MSLPPTYLNLNDVTPPAQVLTQCEECMSSDLFAFDGDVFCNDCGWNSIEMRMDACISTHIAKHKAKRKSAALPKSKPLETSDELFEREDKNALKASDLLNASPMNNDDLSVA